MAVVLSSAEENNYFSLGGRHSHTVDYTPSYPELSPKTNNFSTLFAPSPASPQYSSSVLSSSSTSSRCSSPSSPPTTVNEDSPVLSYTWSPDTRCVEEDEEDQIVFPSYDDNAFCDQTEDLEPPASPRGTGDSYTVSPVSNTISSSVSRPGSPEQSEHAEDDTAIRIQPSRHVDYLSHSWKEEDIWSSWKHIVSRRGAYSNSARLENASWRTWIKAKNNLKTVSPETLNWLKDCDVTWLYGPLQTGSNNLYKVSSVSPESSRISKSGSFLHKKPILKKRSMSEIMLQRSISASSLLKQAAAAVQAQQSDRRPTAAIRAQSDYVTFPFSSRRLSRESTSVLPSISSSGLSSPYEKKHIHFNEQVEQCIALEVKGDEEDDVDAYANALDYSSDSDDAIMMKTSGTGKKLPIIGKRTKKSPPRAASPDRDSIKTIAELPSTTLKYREDTPESHPSAMTHSGGPWSFGTLSPSPSSETLRPSKPRQIIIGQDDDEDEVEWTPTSTFMSRKDSLSVTSDRLSNFHQHASSSSAMGFDADRSGSSSTFRRVGGEEAELPMGMRRTPSGMFMPYDEEDEDAAVSEGLFGKVVDTVNTAKDIAHVIWNVGWRR